MSSATGMLAASFTGIFLGIILAFRSEIKWGSMLANMALAIAFAGLQGYFLFLTGRDLGIVQFLKSKLG